jgi:hypothetical protein
MNTNAIPQITICNFAISNMETAFSNSNKMLISYEQENFLQMTPFPHQQLSNEVFVNYCALLSAFAKTSLRWIVISSSHEG